MQEREGQLRRKMNNIMTKTHKLSTDKKEEALVFFHSDPGHFSLNVQCIRSQFSVPLQDQMAARV